MPFTSRVQGRRLAVRRLQASHRVQRGYCGGLVGLHAHVIPRYAGDVRDLTGGARNVIPSRGNYLKEGNPTAPE